MPAFAGMTFLVYNRFFDLSFLRKQESNFLFFQSAISNQQSAMQLSPPHLYPLPRACAKNIKFNILIFSFFIFLLFFNYFCMSVFLFFMFFSIFCTGSPQGRENFNCHLPIVVFGRQHRVAPTNNLNSRSLALLFFFGRTHRSDPTYNLAVATRSFKLMDSRLSLSLRNQGRE